MYSDKVFDHYRNPRNQGVIVNPTVAIQASNPVCGDLLSLAVLVDQGAIVEIKFQATACIPAVACASWTTEQLAGKRLSDLPQLAAAEIAAALDGLPPASRHASVLAADALRQLIERLASAGFTTQTAKKNDRW
jgi:nitrogen fixation NifU-like protein